MKQRRASRRQFVLGAGALACSLVPMTHLAAQQSPSNPIQLAQETLPTNAPSSSGVPPRQGTPGQAIPPDVSRSASETVIVKAQQRLLKEKNSPSAVTELGERQIQQVGISGSPQTLLRQAPSIYVYQQGIGDSAPELTIRGARGLETATTLDDVPTQDLLAPGFSSIANNIGAIFTLGPDQRRFDLPGALPTLTRTPLAQSAAR